MLNVPPYFAAMQHSSSAIWGGHGQGAVIRPKATPVKYMATYDLMESARNTNEWLGASARAFARYPLFALSMNPFLPLMAAWGDVAERSFSRMITKPDWGIRSIVGPDGQEGALLAVAQHIGAAVFGEINGFHRRAVVA